MSQLNGRAQLRAVTDRSGLQAHLPRVFTATLLGLLGAATAVGCGAASSTTSGADPSRVLFRLSPAVGARYRSVTRHHSRCASTERITTLTQDVVVVDVDHETGIISVHTTATMHTDDVPVRAQRGDDVHWESTSTFDASGRAVGGRTLGDPRIPPDAQPAGPAALPAWHDPGIRVGDSWDESTELDMPDGQHFGLRVHRTLTAIEGTGVDRIAVIDSSSRREPELLPASTSSTRTRVSLADPFVYEAHGEHADGTCTFITDVVAQPVRDNP